MGNRKKSEVNLLTLIPKKTVEFEVDDARIVTVFAPRFRNRIMMRLFTRLPKDNWIRVKLDDVGSAVWLLCDGKRSVGEIADLLRQRFGERIEPCYDRLGTFFQQLETARFVSYVNLDQCLKAPRR